MEEIQLKTFLDYLKPRNRESNKGDFGHVLIIGGCPGYAGATLLAAEAALRVGAGLVSIATHKEHARILTTYRPEIMSHAIRTKKDLNKLIEKATLLVLGPGLGLSRWSKKIYDQSMQSEKNMIVDADALNLLAQEPIQKPNWILTPHPGEAGRLLNQPVDKIQENRFIAVNSLQKKYDGYIVLKGAHTLVAGPESSPAVCHEGNPGMATGGMGDVLSGVLGGLAAQHIPLNIVAQMGVLLHAMAGDLAAKAGERGMIASDLMPALRKLVNDE